VSGAGPSVARLATVLGRVLAGLGVEVPVGSVVLYARALSVVGLEDPGIVYWAGRATLVRRPEDVDAYDRAFGAVFLGHALRREAPAPAVPVTLVTDDAEDDLPGGDAPAEAREVLAVRYSPAEVLSDKDFAACTPEELAEAHRLMRALRLEGPRRRSRRLVPSRRRTAQIDLRRTIRRALRTEGEPLRTAHRGPSSRPRRIVLLCDVSGSMEPYARALLRFLHVAVAGRTRVEAFTLGTRLTRVTRELSGSDPDRALAAAAEAVEDWSGGTRLGEGLHAFNDRFGVRGMARGAVVVVLSDGWDRGDPQLLAAEMARLSRVAHRIVWVNPLKATPGYEPLARGMAAALPYVDEFVPGHSLASLAALCEVVRR
jgi:uncharacterized protein with von Willebrand factor type A (vWA) domain